MKLITNDHDRKIGDILNEELPDVENLKVSIAYFIPDADTINKIKSIPCYKIVVSGEFHINNPNKINQLNGKGLVRFIKPEDRKLHAKVILGTRKNSTQFAIVGSANLTHHGLFSNQEMGTWFDSSSADDIPIISQIKEWLDTMWDNSLEFDYKEALKIFNASKRKWNNRYKQPSSQIDESNYWILKTTEGTNGTDYWQQFLSDSVIAIGWKELNINPLSTSSSTLISKLKQIYDYTDFQAKVNLHTIETFMNKIKPGDMIVISKGYNKVSDREIFLYGLARVTGGFETRPNVNKWIYVHEAAIQPIEEYIPISVFVRAFDIKTMEKTIHSINIQKFTEFSNILHNEYGIISDI